MSETLTLSPPLPSPANGGGEVIAFLAMIERAARDPAFDLDKLDRLLAMREREHARMAEQAFNAALAQAQTEMRPVATDSDNPQTHSRYASYAALDRAVRPIYSTHGFALSFNTADAPSPEQARITCDVSHVAGHTRRYHIDMPIDGKGARGGDVMTKTHAMGSGVSYGMRYLLRMIFNLAIGYDDDGNAAGGRKDRASAAAKDNRPAYVVEPPSRRLKDGPVFIDRSVKPALKPGGIAERAVAARYEQAVRHVGGPSRPFLASEAGRFDERNPPPHDGIPDFLDRSKQAAQALNRRLHPMNDELPGHSAAPDSSYVDLAAK